MPLYIAIYSSLAKSTAFDAKSLLYKEILVVAAHKKIFDRKKVYRRKKKIVCDELNNKLVLYLHSYTRNG